MVVISLLWLLTVSGASALTWGVISSAGAGVGAPSRVTVTTSGESAEPAPGSQSWSGTGGRVTASCTEDAISLGTAVPDVGYWVKVHERGPQRLRIDFESTDSDDRAEVQLVASCVGGRPEFRRD